MCRAQNLGLRAATSVGERPTRGISTCPGVPRLSAIQVNETPLLTGPDFWPGVLMIEERAERDDTRPP
jgi:hypothetical protein